MTFSVSQVLLAKFCVWYFPKIIISDLEGFFKADLTQKLFALSSD